jgi:hypothetical protein
MEYMEHFPVTLPTPLRERWIASSVGATDREMFQHHSPNTDCRRREFRPYRQSQATAFGWIQVSQRHSPPTSRKSWPCGYHEPQTTRRIRLLIRRVLASFPFSHPHNELVISRKTRRIIVRGVSANCLHGFERFNLQNLSSLSALWRVECPHTSVTSGGFQAASLYPPPHHPGPRPVRGAACR